VDAYAVNNPLIGSPLNTIEDMLQIYGESVARAQRNGSFASFIYLSPALNIPRDAAVKFPPPPAGNHYFLVEIPLISSAAGHWSPDICGLSIWNFTYGTTMAPERSSKKGASLV